MKKLFILLVAITLSLTGCKKLFKIIAGKADDAVKHSDDIVKTVDDAGKGLSKGDLAKDAADAVSDAVDTDEEK